MKKRWMMMITVIIFLVTESTLTGVAEANTATASVSDANTATTASVSTPKHRYLAMGEYLHEDACQRGAAMSPHAETHVFNTDWACFDNDDGSSMRFICPEEGTRSSLMISNNKCENEEEMKTKTTTTSTSIQFPMSDTCEKRKVSNPNEESLIIKNNNNLINETKKDENKKTNDDNDFTVYANVWQRLFCVDKIQDALGDLYLEYFTDDNCLHQAYAQDLHEFQQEPFMCVSHLVMNASIHSSITDDFVFQLIPLDPQTGRGSAADKVECVPKDPNDRFNDTPDKWSVRMLSYADGNCENLIRELELEHDRCMKYNSSEFSMTDENVPIRFKSYKLKGDMCSGVKQPCNDFLLFGECFSQEEAILIMVGIGAGALFVVMAFVGVIIAIVGKFTKRRTDVVTSSSNDSNQNGDDDDGKEKQVLGLEEESEDP